MRHYVRAAVGVTAVATTISGLVAIAPAEAGSDVSLPTITIASGARSFTVTGGTAVSAGRVEVDLKAAKGKYFGTAYGIVSFKDGYTFKKLQQAQRQEKAHEMKGGTLDKTGRKGLAKVVKNVTFWGGAQAYPGTTSTMTTVLDPGSYTLYNDSGRVSKEPTKITVTGPAGSTTAPRSSATVVAKDKDRFGGSKTLPTHGTVTFTNQSAEDHFLALIQLKPGTTKHEVAAYLNSGATKEPPFATGEAPGTDLVSAGHSITFTMAAAKGEYLEACFFNDTKTGMEHIYMGMWRIIHVK